MNVICWQTERERDRGRERERERGARGKLTLLRTENATV